MIQFDRFVLLHQAREVWNITKITVYKIIASKILPFLVRRNQVCSASLQAEALRAQLQELAEEEQRLSEELLSAVWVVGEN